MLVVLLGLVSQASRIFQQSNGQRASRQSARILLGLIGRDLESAVFPAIPSSQTGFDFQLNPAVGGGNCLNPSAAFWQTAAAGTGGNQGDIQDVGYFVSWVTVGNQARGTLCRLQIPAADPASIFQNPSRIWTQAILDQFAPGLTKSSLTDPNAYKGLLAENVLGLWIALYDAALNRVPVPYDSRATTVRPAYADISLVTIDPVVGQRLTPSGLPTVIALYASTTNAAAFAAALPAVLRPGAQVFTTRVQIPSGTAAP